MFKCKILMKIICNWQWRHVFVDVKDNAEMLIKITSKMPLTLCSLLQYKYILPTTTTKVCVQHITWPTIHTTLSWSTDLLIYWCFTAHWQMIGQFVPFCQGVYRLWRLRIAKHLNISPNLISQRNLQNKHAYETSLHVKTLYNLI